VSILGVLLLGCALIGLVSSTVYLALAVAATWRFRARRRQIVALPPEKGELLPPVSVLKPLRGAEAKLEGCLESFFRQDYPDFELVFGARGAGDGALSVVERLKAKYPRVKVRTVYSGEPRYPNAKVSALEVMIASPASHDFIVIADSDARVDSQCVREVVRPLLDPQVGLVTCLYRGVPAAGLSSQIEALGMSVEMTAGVLVADMLEGMRFALGPTMAIRKDVLLSVGGIESLGSYCADDYVLGQRAHQAGKTVVLSHHVIEHVAVNSSVHASLQHHLRWMRSTRFSRPMGHVGTGLTFAMPFGILGLVTGLASGRPLLGGSLFAAAVLNRIVLCAVVGWGAVRDRHALGRSWLYPVRDLLGFLVWCWSFMGASIIWRGDRYELERDGRMRPISPDTRLAVVDHAEEQIRPESIR